MSFARVASLTAAAVVIALFGCTSDPEAGGSDGTFCGAASAVTCKEPTDCDKTIANAKGCSTLAKAISPTTLNAAKDCLESGVCGVSNCLARGQKTAKPTAAHSQLAQNYCAFCAPDVEDCENQFYAKKSKLPGGLVLPFGEAIATAVDEACTADRDKCRTKFVACATETIASMVGETLDAELASCVVEAFKGDGTSTGPGGGPLVTTCTAKNCKGCCRDDKCEQGDSEATCGIGAAACEICRGEQKCSSGKCKEPCSPNNCNGCCDGDTCQPGTTTDKCGGAGGACGDCKKEGATYVCSNKTCIDGSCQATCTSGCCTTAGCQPGTAAKACGTGGEGCIDCGVGRACGATTATCEIDPNATWDFYVSFAVIPTKPKVGTEWDGLAGPPDPFLIAYSSQGATTHSGQTTVQNDTTYPFWAELPLKGIKSSELMSELSFELWDSDLEYDDYVGGCSLPIKTSDFSGELLDFKCPETATLGPVELYYRIKPHL